jgi:hypothetical protein
MDLVRQQLVNKYGVESGYVDDKLVTTLYNSKCGLKSCAHDFKPVTFKRSLDLFEISKDIRRLTQFPAKQYVSMNTIKQQWEAYDAAQDLFADKISAGNLLYTLPIL